MLHAAIQSSAHSDELIREIKNALIAEGIANSTVEKQEECGIRDEVIIVRIGDVREETSENARRALGRFSVLDVNIGPDYGVPSDDRMNNRVTTSCDVGQDDAFPVDDF
jgi:hypothetical protein